MKFILSFFFIVVQCLLGQQDLLKEKFFRNLQSIAENADAIVGVAIKDLNTGEQFFINENEIFPQASTIKIHILTEVYKQAAEGKFKLTDIKPFLSSARVGGSGILALLGERTVSMSIRDYCVLMINLSDNSATNLLIDLVGMENVNKTLIAIGATQTKLQRRMMDYQAAKEGRENISTPKELLTILEKMYNGTLVNSQACNDMLAILKLEKDGALKRGIPADVEIANKGGDIEGVRVDAGIVYLKNKPYIICVMTKMLLQDADGPGIITAISKETYHYFERKAHSNHYGRRIPK